jgi:hypothetical protein
MVIKFLPGMMLLPLVWSYSANVDAADCPVTLDHHILLWLD